MYYPIHKNFNLYITPTQLSHKVHKKALDLLRYQLRLKYHAMFDFNLILSKLFDNLFTVISVPIIAALIGWITNYIAVKMIFRPRKAWNILGFKIHGLIPKRQKELAAKIGETVARDLVYHQDIIDAIDLKTVQSEIRSIVSVKIDSFVADYIGKNPMIGMFLQGPMLEQIRSALLSQVESAVPELMESFSTKMESSLDFKQIVQNRVEGFDLSKLEALVYAISAKELKAIELLGGVLGFIVGLLQVAIMLAS
jgi:uncharacterized membrane protein YheB (UPF0754 family)